MNREQINEKARQRRRWKAKVKYAEREIKRTPPEKRYERRTVWIINNKREIIKATKVTDTCWWSDTFYRWRTKIEIQSYQFGLSGYYDSYEAAKKANNRELQSTIETYQKRIRDLRAQKTN